nr:hypothetical protein [Tanacetum cinerariifolium]
MAKKIKSYKERFKDLGTKDKVTKDNDKSSRSTKIKTKNKTQELNDKAISTSPRKQGSKTSLRWILLKPKGCDAFVLMDPKEEVTLKDYEKVLEEKSKALGVFEE